MLFTLCQMQLSLLHGDHEVTTASAQASCDLIHQLQESPAAPPGISNVPNHASKATSISANGGSSNSTALVSHLQLHYTILQTLYLLRVGNFKDLTQQAADEPGPQAISSLESMLAAAQGETSTKGPAPPGV